MIEKDYVFTKQLMLTCMGGRNSINTGNYRVFGNAVVTEVVPDEFTSAEQIENALNNDKWKEGQLSAGL